MLTELKLGSASSVLRTRVGEDHVRRFLSHHIHGAVSAIYGVIRDAAEVTRGQKIRTRLKKGEIRSRVEEE